MKPFYCGFTELKPEIQYQVRQVWIGTEKDGFKFTDFLYEVSHNGAVLSRKLITEVV